MARHDVAALAQSLRLTPGQTRRVDAALFKVLVDTRIRIAATADALDARRDFFLADADLRSALTFVSGSTTSPAANN